jgi:predicted transcriptional regulator YdeE
MTGIQPERFADGRPRLLAGIRRTHTFADAPRTIPAQWRDLDALGPIPGRQGTEAYGAICGADPGARTMEFLCGVEVASFGGLPPETGRMRVPPQHYAVFVHRGGAATLQDTWMAIWEWLPRSGYVSAQTPDFELYGDRWDSRTGTGEIEIWLPVARAPSGDAPSAVS